MKHYDFFVSHSNEDRAVIERLVEEIEQKGAKCWVSYRDIDGGIPYSKAIVNGIKDSKVFLLCLSKDSAVSDQVLNEIEIAYKRVSGEDRIILQPLFLENFAIDNEEYDALTYYIKRFNYIIPKDCANASEIANEVVKNNVEIFKHTAQNSETVKGNSSYFVDKKELDRLKKQAEIGLKFDKDIYEKIIKAYRNPAILDLGSGDGGQLSMRLEGIDNYTIIGVDVDDVVVKSANSTNGGERSKYYQMDIESPEFINDIKEIMIENGLDGFDIINIVYVLKHLKNPRKVLYKIRRLLRPNGVLLITEAENCIEYAVPDENKYFERIFNILNYDEYAGANHMGREVYNMLFETGYSNIKLERMGAPTMDYTIEEKELMYDVCFAYVKDDLKLMMKKYPENEMIREDYEWYMEKEDEIEAEFLKPGFLFLSGDMFYSAQK